MASTKADIRATVLAARRAVLADVRLAESENLGRYLVAATRPGDTVCAYVPVGSEPGSVAVLDALLAAGVRVLLPVARADDAGVSLPLNWGVYLGELVPAPFGLREPAGPHLPAEAVGTASTIVVPALAVDLAGSRLGRGAGFYDRSLELANPVARLVAMVRDQEVLDRLPAEPHDVPMTHALTPGRGLVELGMARPS